MDSTTNGDIVVVMIPFLGQSHLNSMLELAHRIISYRPQIPVHYITSPSHIRQAQSRVHGYWNPLAIPNLHFSSFEIPDFENPPPNPNDNFPSHLYPCFNAALELRQPVAEFVNNLFSSPVKRVIVIHDTQMTWVIQDVISLPNVETYCFHPVSALSLLADLLKANVNIDITRLPGDFQALIQEIASLESSDLPPAVREFADKQSVCGYQSSRRNIFTSCRPLEGIFTDLLMQQVFKYYDYFKIWALGVFFNPLEAEAVNKYKKAETMTQDRHRLLLWLDKQEPNSVIFVSFGTTISFQDEQIIEMAIGLEQSQQKFIWVLKEADRGDALAGKGRQLTLPEGYEERVQGRGIIESDWAPQLDVLGHPSTGGFMSHCGWNSCLESISMGVPVAAWPMHTDQPINALFMTRVMKVGIFAREWTRRNELVKAETIKTTVETLMGSPEGENLRKNAKELRDTVKASFMEGGSTQKDIESFMFYITR